MFDRLRRYSDVDSATSAGIAVGSDSPDATLAYYPDISSESGVEFLDMMGALLQFPDEHLAVRIEIYPTAPSRLSRLRALSMDARSIFTGKPADVGYISEIALMIGVEYGAVEMMEFYQRIVEGDVLDGESVEDVFRVAGGIDGVDEGRVRESVRSGEYLGETLQNGRRWVFDVLGVVSEEQRERNSVLAVNGMVVDELSMDAIASAAASIPTLEEIMDINEGETF